MTKTKLTKQMIGDLIKAIEENEVYCSGPFGGEAGCYEILGEESADVLEAVLTRLYDNWDSFAAFNIAGNAHKCAVEVARQMPIANRDIGHFDHAERLKAVFDNQAQRLFHAINNIIEGGSYDQN